MCPFVHPPSVQCIFIYLHSALSESILIFIRFGNSDGLQGFKYKLWRIWRYVTKLLHICHRVLYSCWVFLLYQIIVCNETSVLFRYMNKEIIEHCIPCNSLFVATPTLNICPLMPYYLWHGMLCYTVGGYVVFLYTLLSFYNLLNTSFCPFILSLIPSTIIKLIYHIVDLVNMFSFCSLLNTI